MHWILPCCDERYVLVSATTQHVEGRRSGGGRWRGGVAGDERLPGGDQQGVRGPATAAGIEAEGAGSAGLEAASRAGEARLFDRGARDGEDRDGGVRGVRPRARAGGERVGRAGGA